MMTIDETKTVREFALELPSSIAVFEKLGIDYCCGGHKPLSEACAAAGIAVPSVTAALDALGVEQQSRTAAARDWRDAPLSDLVAHIVNTHHAYVRRQIPTLRTLLDKVVGKHGARHSELGAVRESFQALADELTMHLMKEEQILFPYIERAEESSVQHEAPPPCCFGSIENPIRMMMSEHDNAGEVLRAMRRATADYTAPADGCATYRGVYALLREFEADLHQHIHLENNVLFPRATELAAVPAGR